MAHPVYGFVVGPQQPAGQQQLQAAAAAAAAAVSYVFAAAHLTNPNPYAMTWDAYNTHLKPHLDATYPAVRPPAVRQAPAAAAAAARAQPAAAAAAQAQAQAQPPEGPLNHIQSKNRIRALNGGTPGDFPRGPIPAGWNQGHVNGMINRADGAISAAIKNADPFNKAAYDAAMLAWLNTAANQRWQGGPQGLDIVMFRI